MKKKLLTMVVAGALITSCMSSGVLAATKSTTSSKNSISIQDQKAAFKESTMETVNMVTKFGSYVKINSSGEVYLTKTASQIGVSQAEYDKFMKGVKLENESIKKGELSLVLDKNGNAIDVKTNLNINVVKGQNPGLMQSDISVSNHWYGWQLKLSESDTVSLEKALGVGSAAAWLAGELSAAGVVTIPASIPIGIIAASGGLAAATLVAVDQGDGISIYYNIETSVGWIWPN